DRSPRLEHRSCPAHSLVGVAGLEPTASSSRIRLGPLPERPVSSYELVRARVHVGLRWSIAYRSTRSSPCDAPGRPHPAEPVISSVSSLKKWGRVKRRYRGVWLV